MSDDTTASETGTESADSEFAAITSQADLDAIIGERVKREKAKFADYKSLKAKADAFDQAEADKLSEIEKANKRAEAAEQRAAEVEAAKALSDLAAAKSIPVAALSGSPEERAEAIAALVAESGKPRTPAPDPNQGRSNATPLNGDGLEAALRSKLGI